MTGSWLGLRVGLPRRPNWLIGDIQRRLLLPLLGEIRGEGQRFRAEDVDGLSVLFHLLQFGRRAARLDVNKSGRFERAELLQLDFRAGIEGNVAVLALDDID